MSRTHRAASWLRGMAGGVLAAARARVRAVWRRGLAMAVLSLVLALLAVSGAGFLVLAAYLALAQVMAPWSAALIVGGALVGVALLGALGVWLILRGRHDGAASQSAPPAAGAPADADERPVDMAARLGEDLGQRLGRRGVRVSDVMVAALVAGTLLGASPALRARLFRNGGVPPRQRERRRC
ncbi:MAG: hypothetical protein U5S82_01570 [Gammaproteobacteria bacterium]|nr:hypothetical protein [Gammaproteobacteria bacterium]